MIFSTNKIIFFSLDSKVFFFFFFLSLRYYSKHCGGGVYLVISVDMHVNEFSSVFYGYCSQYYVHHKYNTKLYNRVKEME